jgi:hypothetical protein
MKLFRLILPVALIAAGGCGGKNVLTNPAFQPEIVNLTDSFSLQATNVTGVTQTIQWTWQNTGTNAVIDHSSMITGGTAIMTILDSNGVQLYMEPLAQSGNPNIGSGAPGGWVIRLTLTNVSGTLNFRVQKAT